MQWIRPNRFRSRWAAPPPGHDRPQAAHPAAPRALVSRVLTRFVLEYTVRVAHLERGGINLDFAVEDAVLPSAEPTHEGDLVDETQSIVTAPPQGDLPPIGFEKAGIANQTGARDVGVGDRQGSVRNKRPL